MRPVVVLILLLVASLAYLAPFVRSGWVPHDEGLLGGTAERVMAGERPHVDFDDPYTGGQAYLHALAFRIGGARLSTLRWLLYAFSIPFIVALWAIARRALSPWWAAAVAGAGVVWSLPNYFASLPSWYNLFFALFGLVALLRWLETRGRWWIVAAGLCGGLSILVKISGLYFVAAVFVVLLHADDEQHRRTRLGAIFAIAGSVLAALFPIFILAKRVSIESIAHFVIPPALICLVIASDAWRRGAAPPGVLLRRVALLAVGVVLPISCFAAPYVAAGRLRMLLDGIFIAPQRRLAFAAFDLPPLWTSIAALPLVFALLPARSRTPAIVAGVVALAAIPFVSDAPLYDAIWWAVRSFLLGLTIVAAYLLIRYPVQGRQRQELVAVLAVASFCALIQFPYAYGIYFCYVAPLVLLVAVFLLRYRSSIDPRYRASLDAEIEFPFAAAALAFATAFAIVWLNTSRITTFGERYERRSEVKLLLPARANLDVPAVHADGYTQLVQVIDEHARSGVIYAFPDCPEVYFLAGKRSPTRGFYDFLGVSDVDTIIDDVDVVVINHIPEFSPPVDDRVAAMLRQRFREGREIGPFEVRWRSEAK
ncbi:MAG TPA: hypothetical protein VGQ36_22670 [Thermoanaerobaculia bacterium]|jgi:hypothetical protein|nr:hypothetical protein [Thermoanaerobaculia bacterium]